MTLGDRIRDRRKWLGLSQKELARRLDVKDYTIQRWEVGRARPSRENMEALCKALEVRWDYFAGVGPEYKNDTEHCLLFDPDNDAAGLRAQRRCEYADCKACGWYGPEMERRNEKIRRRGLERLGNGLLGLKVGMQNGQTEKA